MDKIFLKNLRLKTRIGLFDWEKQIDQISLLHWTLGGPWFDKKNKFSHFSQKWFNARNDSIRI